MRVTMMVLSLVLTMLMGCATLAQEGHTYVDLGAEVGHAVVETGETFYEAGKGIYEWVKCLIVDCPPEPTVEEAAHANPELRAPVLAAGEFDFVQPPGGHP